MFAVFAGLGVLIACVLSGIYYVHSYLSLKEHAQKEFSDIAERTAQSLEREIDNLDMISCQVFGNKTIQRRLFYALQEKQEGVNYFEQNLEAVREVQEALWSFNSPRKTVTNLSIIYPDTFIGLLETPSVDEINTVWNSGIYDAWEGDCKLIPTHKDPFAPYGENDDITVSFLRKQILSFYGQQEFGVIEVQQDYGKIKDICRQNYNSEEMSLYVLDNDGSVIYPYQETGGMEEEIVKIFANEEEGTLFTGTYGKKEIGIYRKIENTPWNIVLLQNHTQFVKPIFLSLSWILILGIVMVILVVCAVYAVTARLTDPIVRLRKAVESDEMRQTLNFSELKIEVDEVHLLQKAFSEMILYIKASTEQIAAMRENELELRIAALQAQINPHFLYNSLAAIGAAGTEDGSFRTQMMCVELSGLLRYSGSDIDRQVEIQTELDNLRSYLNCMKWRYEDNLQFSMQIEGKTNVDMIPKLTFQPLVENSFIHGFASILPPYRIEIQCAVSENGWIFEARDNGSGIEEERLRKIHRSISEIDRVFSDTREYRSIRTENMAILNIYVRLKKEYGEKIRFRIENNTDEKGTSVRLEIER